MRFPSTPAAARRVVVDNNCLVRFAAEGAIERLQANLRITDMHVWVSSVNVLEAARTSDPTLRARLLGILRQLADPAIPVLPHPLDLMEKVGLSIYEKIDQAVIDETNIDRILQYGRVGDSYRRQLAEKLSQSAAKFDEIYESARRRLFRDAKAGGLTRAWANTGDFLAETWRTSDMRRDVMRLWWNGLRLPGNAPLDELADNETWQIAADIEGAAFYERMLAHEKPRHTHRWDWFQLLYMSTAWQRILVTRDGPFAVSAAHILRRYPNTRVVPPAALLE